MFTCSRGFGLHAHPRLQALGCSALRVEGLDQEVLEAERNGSAGLAIDQIIRKPQKQAANI